MRRPSQAKPSTVELLPIFTELLPTQKIEEWVKASGKTFYQRLFTPLIVLWGFIYQRLNADHTCDEALSYLASGQVDHLDTHHKQSLSERIKSVSTAAYCKARNRLPLSVLQSALFHTSEVIEQALGQESQWRGYWLGLLDGSTLYLSPEPELVEHYGRHKNGAGETYWVVMRIVVAFGLRTAATLGVAEGPLSQSEQSLAKSVLAQARPNSLYVADSNFGVFSVAQAARHYEVKGLFRMTKTRALALAGRQLRPNEDIPVTWHPSKADQLDPAMSPLPLKGRLIYVRLLRNGFRPLDVYLFTTLLDPELYPLTELVKLYNLRWHVELDLRYVKTTLDMEHLTGKTVDIIRKELHAGLLAYNLIRGYMVQAAKQTHLSPLTLSFSRCWRRVWNTLCSVPSTDPPHLIHQATSALLNQLAQCKLPPRKPFRIEPRAVRGRPQAYPKLKGSREQARQRILEERQLSAKNVKTPPSIELPPLIIALPTGPPHLEPALVINVGQGAGGLCA